MGIVAGHAGKISAGAYRMRIYARWGSVQSHKAAHMHTNNVRPRRRRSLFYVPSVLYCRVRVLQDRTNVSNDRGVEVEGIDGHERLLSGIDTTEWVEIIEECAQE